MSSPGIPTLYQGIRFRSRLEATWSAFFDQLGWPWQYEPLDLAGYIPDFVLPVPHGPVLVEVKPEVSLSALEFHTAPLERSSWAHEALLVGTEPFWESAELGLLAERDNQEWWWDPARFFECAMCQRPAFTHGQGSYRCRVTGCYDGGGNERPIDARPQWARAKNAVQWKR